jgi:DNA-binding MarR family transcriptional regulator
MEFDQFDQARSVPSPQAAVQATRSARVARRGNFGHPLAVVRQSGLRRRRRHAGCGAIDGAMGSQGPIEGESSTDQCAAPVPGNQAALKLENFLPYQLNVVASLTSQALSRVYARRYRIGVPEWRVLVTLGQYGVMTGKAIGAHSHMHKTKVSRAVALLEKRRLLARRANREDMREAFLSLTSAGRAMYEELAPHALEFARRLTDILTPQDREAFNRAVQQLTARSAELAAEVALEGKDDED